MLKVNEAFFKPTTSRCSPPTCRRMTPPNLFLELKIGIPRVKDGVDNNGVSKEKLYSTPEDVYKVWRACCPPLSGGGPERSQTSPMERV